MKIKLLFTLFIFFAVVQLRVSGQQEMNPAGTDILTYRYYLEKNWDSLLYTGNQSLKQGIDFYYLRVRMGIAWYEKQRYLKALQQFNKALEYQPYDPLSLEYSYYAGLFSGRPFEAKQKGALLPEKKREELKIKNRIISGISADYTFSSSGGGKIPPVQEPGIAGTQQIPDNFSNFNLTVHHEAGKRLSITQAYTLLLKNSLTYQKNEITDSYSNQKITQNQYYLSGSFYAGKGMILSAAWHQLWITIPSSTGNAPGQGKKPGNSSPTLKNYSFSASVDQSIGIINLGYCFSLSNLNNDRQIGHTIRSTIYPLGNLNLYVSANFSLQEQNRNKENNYITEGILGIKISPKIWGEASFLTGNIINFSDMNSYIIYNDVNTLHTKTGLSLLFPAKNGTVFSLRGYRTEGESRFSDTQTLNQPVNFSTFSITGGISWTF